MEPAQRCARVGAAGRAQEFGCGGLRPFRPVPREPETDLGARGLLRVVRDPVEEDVGPLVDEVTDGRGVHAGLQHPLADAVETERGQPHHAVAGDVLVVGGRCRLLALLGQQRLVHRCVGDDPDGFEDPELVVQPHHGFGDLLQDVVRGLSHVLGHHHGRGEGGQRHGAIGGTGLRKGQQIEIGEHPVEEFGLLLRVPVEGVEVDAAVLADEVGEVVEGGGGGVRVHRLQAVEPDREDVPRRSGGQQGQVLADRDGALRLAARPVPRALVVRVLEVDEPRVDGQAPCLAGVRRTVLVVTEPEVLGGGGQLRVDEFATGTHPGPGARPAGEADCAGEQRSGQRVPCQLGLGVQPHRRQGGALCGHQGVSSGHARAVCRGPALCVRVLGRGPSVDAFRTVPPGSATTPPGTGVLSARLGDGSVATGAARRGVARCAPLRRAPSGRYADHGPTRQGRPARRPVIRSPPPARRSCSARPSGVCRGPPAERPGPPCPGRRRSPGRRPR